jgi:acyl-coenzyme A thioesterase PaaI-like protein
MGSRALDRLMWRLVPFNRVLRPHVLSVTVDEVRVELKLRRILHNHLGTMHAAALVSVAEYAQGLLITANAGGMGAELILARLSMDYLAKARGDVVATARLAEGVRQQVVDALGRGDNTELTVQSVVTDAATGQDLAVLKGTWRARPPR